MIENSPYGFILEWNLPSSPNGNIQFYQVKLFVDENLDLPAMLAVHRTTSLAWHLSLGILSKCVPTLLDVAKLLP